MLLDHLSSGFFVEKTVMNKVIQQLVFVCVVISNVRELEKYVLEETSFLNSNDSEELRQRMATWYDIPFPLDPRHSIGGLIDEHVKMKNLMS